MQQFKLKSAPTVDFNDRKIYSALNATFFSEVIGSLEDLPIEDYLFWPDGLGALLVAPTIRRFPGRDLLASAILDLNAQKKKALLLGGPFDKDKMAEEFSDFEMIGLGFGTPEELFEQVAEEYIRKSKNKDCVFICIPSPKQDVLAEKLFRLNPDTNILCIGGAMNMIGGTEVVAPRFVHFIGLEWLWRLRTDTKRRVLRLAGIFFNIFRGYLKFRQKYYVKIH